MLQKLYLNSQIVIITVVLYFIFFSYLVTQLVYRILFTLTMCTMLEVLCITVNVYHVT